MSYFETRFEYDESRKGVWEILAGYLKRYIPESSKIIEIGPGYCFFINAVDAKEKYAMDVDRIILKYCGKGVKPVIGSCTKMKFKDGFFDVIFASNILEHLTQEELLAALREFNRVLRKGGKLIVISPNFRYAFREYFDDYTHKVIITHTGFMDMLRGTGFYVEVCKPKFLPFSIKSRLPKSNALLKAYLKSPFKPFAKQFLIVAKKKG